MNSQSSSFILPPSPFRLPPSSSFLPAKRRVSLPLAHRSPAAARGNRAAAGRIGDCSDRPVGGVAARRAFVAFRAAAAGPPGPGLRAVGRAGAGLPFAAEVRGRLVGRVSDLPPGNDRGGVGTSHGPGGGHAGPLAAAGPCDWNAGCNVCRAMRRRSRRYGCRWGCFDPRPPRRILFQLVQLQLERLRIPSPVTDVRVAGHAHGAVGAAPAGDAVRLLAATTSRASTGRAWRVHHLLATLVERLSSRLGRERRGRACGCGPRHSRNCPGITIRWWKAGGVAARGRRCRPSCRRVRCDCCRVRCWPCAIVRPRRSAAPDGPPLRFHLAGQEHHMAQVGGRSGSKPAGGAAGRWAATISASKPPPAAASGSSAGCAMENGFCTERLSRRIRDWGLEITKTRDVVSELL